MSSNNSQKSGKKLVIFGATGTTGLCSLEHALTRGFVVRVFLRDTKTLPDEFHDKVELFVGDVTDSGRVEKAIEGQDKVLVVLGTRNSLEETSVLSCGMNNIVDGMQKNGVKTVSVCLSAFLFYEPEKVPQVYKKITKDHQLMLDKIKASDLNWIAVLPPHITDKPSAAYTVKYDESPGRSITKFDLGKFLVECLECSDHYKKVCGIATL